MSLQDKFNFEQDNSPEFRQGSGILRMAWLQSDLFYFNKQNMALYRGADKSLARPPSRCILFDSEIIRLMLVLLYI
jgi:hypothetical protein